MSPLLLKALFMNDNKLRNYLNIALILTLLVLAYSAYVYVDSYSKSIQPSSFRSFSVSGEGKVVAIPDVARFSFGLITQGGKDIANLQKENTNKINKIISFVKESGVDAKDIETLQYNLEPRYQNYSCPISNLEAGLPCPPAEIVGYSISQNVSVKIRDFNKIGSILAGVVQNGANNVSQLSFTIDEPYKVESEAREKAIAQAKSKALSTAKAGGFRLGRLLSINEDNVGVPRYYALSAGFETKADGAFPSPTIEPGSQEVKININLVYEIK